MKNQPDPSEALVRISDELWEWNAGESTLEIVVVAIPLNNSRALSKLTHSERNIVALALNNESNADIAMARGKSVKTVANQLAAIYRKLGITSRSQLASFRFSPAGCHAG